MKPQTLMAFTPPGMNPPYMNVTQHGGIVTVTVRNAAGETAAMSMGLGEWVKQVEASRSKVMFADDPRVNANEVIRDWSNGDPSKPPEPVPS